MPTNDRRHGRGRKLRPPPNYFSRKVQLRLLTLVALLMGILLLMPLAADPRNYWWMGFDKSGGTADHKPQPEPDTRLSPESLHPKSPEKSAIEVTPESLTADEPKDSLYLAQKDAWAGLLRPLSRGELDLLNRALRHLRHGSSLAENDRPAWRLLVEQFDDGWQQYLFKANASLLSMPPDEQTAWKKVLSQLEADWTKRLEPALLAAAEDRPLTDEQAQQIGRFQALLDRLSLDRVEDDAPYQAVERDAWFRLLEMLQHTSLDQLDRESIGEVGYIQLFEQSKEYRGKLVTVHGHVRQAYTFSAPPNDFGIETYFIFWLAPEHGPNSPLVVYALEPPPGFPKLGPKSQAEREHFDEEVEVTGFFFKRWAYPAQDGPRSAPLLLAKMPRWERPPAGAAMPLSPLLVVGICVVGATAAAVVVTLLVFRFGRAGWQGFRMPSLRDARADDLKALEQIETAPGVQQTLAQLARDDK